MTAKLGDGRRVEAGARQGAADDVVHPLDRRERHVRLQLAQHRLDRRRQGRGVGVRADDEIAGLVPHPRLLRLRRVDARRRRNPQGELSHVAHDADDFDLQRPAPVERQASADRVLRAEVDARQALVDRDDGRRAVHVAAIERTSRDDRDAHRLEIVGPTTRISASVACACGPPPASAETGSLAPNPLTGSQSTTDARSTPGSAFTRSTTRS